MTPPPKNDSPRKSGKDRRPSIGRLMEEDCFFRNDDGGAQEPYYGDLTELNRCRLILDSVGKEALERIAADAIDLLETSVAIYEANGDYAFGMFSSGWCRLMDSASRKRCDTDDNREALTGGCWLCHESCWNDSATPALETGRSTDISCVGGIHLYAEPIFAGDRIVGVINIGYGNPPRDPEQLDALAKRFGIDPGELQRRAESYRPRPRLLVELAKNRLKTSARLIGAIVEKTQAQRALQESKTLLDETGRMAKVGGWELDAETLEVTWTDATHRIHEVPLDVQPPLEEAIRFFHPDDRDRLTRALQRALNEGEPYDMQLRLTTAKGTPLWARTKCQPVVENQKVVKLRGTFQDITDQKQSETSLVHQREVLQGIFDNIPVLLVFWDPQLQRFTLNRHAESVLGYTTAEANQGDFMEKVYPDAAYRARAVAYMASLEPGYREWSMTAKNGESIPIDWANIRLSDDAMIGIGLDLREEKRAIEALKKSEARFRSLFENMYDGVAIYRSDNDGEDFRFVDINRSGQSLSKVRREDIVGKRLTEVFPGVTEMGLLDVFRRVYKTGATEHLPITLYRDQRIFEWVDNTVFRLPTDEIVAVYRDESERHAAEEKLRDLYEAMDLAQKMAGIGYWSFDKKTGKRMWSSQMFKVFGIEPTTGAPSPLELKKLFFHEDWGPYERAFQGALEGTPYVLVIRIHGKDGDTRYVHTQGYPKTDRSGAVVGSIGTSQDITQRVLAEKALKASEEKYRNIFENAVEGFFRSTPEGRFTEVNPAFARMLGYDSPEDVVSTISDIATEYYVDPEDRRRYQETLRRSGTVDNMQFRVKRKDGTQIWVSNSTRAYFDKNGNVIRYEGFVTDITERIKAEEEKEKLRFQLVQGQKMQAIGTLAGGIAHDFNNILASIIGFTELAIDEVEKGTVVEDSLQEVYAAGKRARDLVRQILTIGRHDEKKFRPVQVGSLIKEILKMLRSTIPSSIQLKEVICSEPLVVEADPTQLQQVVINLATNARQAMADGPGVLKVTVDAIEPGPEMHWRNPDLPPGKFARITVSDTGVGIPKEHLDKIFEPYFTTKKKGEGSGLGLSVVHGIIESHRGYISVSSEPGKRTTFSVSLPLVKKAADKWPEKTTGELPKGTERILLVDDEPPIVKMQQQNLERLGYTVTARTSSLEALEAFRASPEAFDLVITDMTMPRMTGDRLAHEIKAIRPSVPVILCTGFSEKIEDQGSNLEIDGLLMKPVDKFKMARTIREVLDSSVRNPPS